MSAGNPDPDTVGVLLAGGRARRMGGGDKCLRPLAGRPLLAHVVERVGPQVDRLVLRSALEVALRDEGISKVDRWTSRYRLAVADFDSGPPDPFFNANRPEDLETAEKLLAGD